VHSHILVLSLEEPLHGRLAEHRVHLLADLFALCLGGGIIALTFVLSDAEKQIRETGTLSPQTSELLVRCFGKQEAFQPTEGDRLSRVIADQDMLLGWIADRKARLEGSLEIRLGVEARQCADDLAYHSLPPADDLDKIIRYEKRTHKQLDWALRRLLASQEARKARLPSPALSGNVRARRSPEPD
jgi:hypothetical protein